MKMAKSTYYFELNKVDAVAEKNGDLLLEIQTIFYENKGRYGVRRIYQNFVVEVTLLIIKEFNV